MTWKNSTLGGLAAASTLFLASPAMAQPSDEVSVKVLQLLVDEGIIPLEKAQSILDQAREEAQAKAAAEANRAASDVINVPYVPEALQEDITEKVGERVVATAKQEGWVAPNSMPKWVEKISISGDLRIRGQYDNFAKGNFPYFPDANAINRQGGVTTTDGFPLLNSTVDRERISYRARLAIDADVTKGLSVGLRFASGDEPGAVSTNSTFGDFFDRDELWIDRAFVDFEPVAGGHVIAGRMPNPFFSTDLVWDEDINPEGIALAGEHPLGEDVSLRAVAGIFPLQERELFDDAYLYAGQIGARYGNADSPYFVEAGAAYYHYANIQSLKNPPDGSRINDWSAPAALSKGNSLFNIRTDGLTTLAGLAAEYELVAGTIQTGYRSGPLTFSLTGEVVKNLALDPAEIAALRKEEGVNGGEGVKPGDLGWMVRFQAGYPVIAERGQWRLFAGYRHLETDAVLDIFTDSDFGLGGTDVEGYELGGAIGIHKNASLGFRWLSSDSIARAPFSVDVLQIDLNTRF